MRPAPPYRRHSAIALVFAAWCAAYGIPAELARSLTVQTAGPSHLIAARPGHQAKVLLNRLSTRVRRGDQVRVTFFDAFLTPVSLSDPIPGSIIVQASSEAAAPAAFHGPQRYQRPPPVSFPA